MIAIPRDAYDDFTDDDATSFGKSTRITTVKRLALADRLTPTSLARLHRAARHQHRKTAPTRQSG